MKVIVAGFPKTGTKSMAAALQELGYTVYDFMECATFLKQYWERIMLCGGSTDDFRKMYENVDAVTDVPACYYWEEIHKAFPDAKIVFTTRDNEDIWVESMDTQRKVLNTWLDRLIEMASPTARTLIRFGELVDVAVFGNKPVITFCGKRVLNHLNWRMAYRRHKAYVLQNAPKDKLLVYSVSEGWGPLCKFLEMPVPAKPFPHKNVKGNIKGDLLATNPTFIRIHRESICFLGMLGCMIFSGAALFTCYSPTTILRSGFYAASNLFKYLAASCH